MRSSLSRLAAAGRDPDPAAARKAARDAWREHGIVLINLAWLPGWADQKQAELLAEKIHGPRKWK